MFTRLEPRAEVSATRCASPPLSVLERAVEREVTEADRVEVRQPGFDLLQDGARDAALPLVKLQSAEEGQGVGDLHRGEFGDVPTAHAGREASGRSRAPRHSEHTRSLRQRLRNTRIGVLYFRRSSHAKKPLSPPKSRSGTPSWITFNCRSSSCRKGTSTGTP
jgi:hypothetical protein